jgi:hypothetical protein
LPATDGDALKRWSKALGIDPGPVKLIAYVSGAWYTGLYNLARGEFDEGAVNTGTVKRLKRGVNIPSPVEERLEAAGLLDIPSSIEVR